MRGRVSDFRGSSEGDLDGRAQVALGLGIAEGQAQASVEADVELPDGADPDPAADVGGAGVDVAEHARQPGGHERLEATEQPALAEVGPEEPARTADHGVAPPDGHVDEAALEVEPQPVVDGEAEAEAAMDAARAVDRAEA